MWRYNIHHVMSQCSPCHSPFGVRCLGGNLVEFGTLVKSPDVIKVPTKLLRRQLTSTLSINTTSLEL